MIYPLKLFTVLALASIFISTMLAYANNEYEFITMPVQNI
jgi:hypothetical protein